MNGTDAVWTLGRATIGTAVRIFAPLRVYGASASRARAASCSRSTTSTGSTRPRSAPPARARSTTWRRSEAHVIPGLGQLIRAFGTFSVRRGESDREAVRMMRKVVTDGHALGLFVEGTRQRSGVPGEVKPGAAMVALQEDVPVVAGGDPRHAELEARQLPPGLDRLGRADELRRPAAEREGLPRGLRRDPGRDPPPLGVPRRRARRRAAQGALPPA